MRPGLRAELAGESGCSRKIYDGERQRDREGEGRLAFLSYASRYTYLLGFSPLMSPDRTAPYVSPAGDTVCFASSIVPLLFFVAGLYDRSYLLLVGDAPRESACKM